jgi:hypothetical protein
MPPKLAGAVGCGAMLALMLLILAAMVYLAKAG